MTVEELIKHLQTFPPKMKVGRVGHFGEFHEMDKHDFSASKVYSDEGFELDRQLHIEPPDIGDPPE